MSVPAAILSLAPQLEGLFKAINEYLSKRKVKEADKTEVKKKVDSLKELSNELVNLVELSNKSSQKLDDYVKFMKQSIAAEARCTQLARDMETLPNDKAKDQLENLIGMMTNLQTQGIQEIKDYAGDFQQAMTNYNNAEKYANRAKEEIESNRKNSCVNMNNLNSELGQLTQLASTRVKGIIRKLQNAYKVFEKPAK